MNWITPTRQYQQRGQILPAMLVLLTFTALLFLYIINAANVMHQKVNTQMQADLLALSASRLQARALNSIAYLNIGIDSATKASNLIIAKGVVLTVCAATCGWATLGTCPCVAQLAAYLPRAYNLLKDLYDFANDLAKEQDKLIDNSPLTVALSMAHLWRANNLDDLGVHYPGRNSYMPAFPSLARPALAVHRESNNPLEVKKCDKKKKTKKSPAGQVICKDTMDFLGRSFYMPGLIRLNDDFPEVQKITVLASKMIDEPIINKSLDRVIHKLYSRQPLSASRDSLEVRALAQSHVMNDKGKYDQSLMRPNWDGYLEPVTEHGGFFSLKLESKFNEILH